MVALRTYLLRSGCGQGGQFAVLEPPEQEHGLLLQREQPPLLNPSV